MTRFFAFASVAASILLCNQLTPHSVMAETLPPTSVAQVQTSDGTFTCGLIGGAYQPGTYKSQSQKFTTLQVQLQNAKKKKKKVTGSSLVKIKKTIKRLKTVLPQAQSGCASINSLAPTPTPTAPPSGTVPAPTPAATCYDTSRNVSPGYLNIPSGTVGNFFVGQLIFSRTCTSCHLASDKQGYDFSALSAALPGPNMNLNLSVQERAHLTAYLNYPNC